MRRVTFNRAMLGGGLLLATTVTWLVLANEAPPPRTIAPGPAAGAPATESEPGVGADPAAAASFSPSPYPSPVAAAPALPEPDDVPGGAVELDFVDDRGKPVSGVRAMLLPPCADGLPWDERWRSELSTVLDRKLVGGSGRATARAGERELAPEVLGRGVAFAGERTSDSAGRSRWSSVPNAQRYQWALVSEHFVVTEPAFPKLIRSLRDDEGLLDVSGPFDVAEDGVVHLHALVLRPASVRGILNLEPGGKPGLVDVRHRIGEERSGSSLVLDASIRTDPEGAFELRRLRPGDKVLWSHWDVGEQDFRFASQAFRLAPGEALDLGRLLADLGEELHGLVQLQEESWGWSWSLTIEEIFGRPVELLADLTVANFEAGDDPALSVRTTIPVRVDRPFTLGGLRRGPCTLRAAPRPDWPPPRSPALHCSAGNTFLVSVQHESRDEEPWMTPVGIDVSGLRAIVLDPRPMPDEQETLHVRVLCLDTGRHFVTQCHRGEPLRFLEGRYELLVRSERDGGKRIGAAAVQIESLEIADDGPVLSVPVELQPIATVRGMVRDAEGMPVPNVSLRLAPATPVGPDGERFWIHEVWLDAQGRFTLEWALPGSELVVDGSSATVTMPPSGETVEVELVLDR